MTRVNMALVFLLGVSAGSSSPWHLFYCSRRRFYNSACLPRTKIIALGMPKLIWVKMRRGLLPVQEQHGMPTSTLKTDRGGVHGRRAPHAARPGAAAGVPGGAGQAHHLLGYARRARPGRTRTACAARARVRSRQALTCREGAGHHRGLHPTPARRHA